MTFLTIDPQNMHSAIKNFSEQLVVGMDVGKSIKLNNNYDNIQNIVVAGMGGSAIGGDVVRVLVSNNLKVPFFVSRNYKLPGWVGKNTLVICSSYSGNTEETLTAYDNALAAGATICGITTGGKLEELLVKNSQDIVRVSGGLQPRAALAYSVIPMLYLLSAAGKIDINLSKIIPGTVELIRNACQLYQKKDKSNPAYALAEKVAYTLPVIYGENEATAIIASRWKGQFCENAKMLAYHNELPELNHNEVVGWENNTEIQKHISILWLLDADDQPRVSMRQDITSKILENLPAYQEKIKVAGENRFERYFHLIHFGDWVSYWCAIIHSTDPSPVKKIDFLKSELAK